jgi:hypothetical protein
VEFELTDDQCVALNLVYEPFRDGGDWPQQRYVEKALRRQGLSLDLVFEGMPQGLTAPDLTRTQFYVRPDDPIALTIAGMSACSGSSADIELFLRALQFFVLAEESYSPPPTGGTPLYVGTADLVNDLGLTQAQAARVYQLTRHEIGILGGGGGNPNNWQFELTPEIQCFVGATTIERYLEERIVPPPYPPKAVDLRSLVSTSPFSLPAAFALEVPTEDELAPAASPLVRWPGLMVVNRVLEQPIVAGIIAAVVAGIILAAILGH